MHLQPVPKARKAGCQNYGPFCGTLNIRCRIRIGIQRRDHNFDNHIRTTSRRTTGKAVGRVAFMSSPSAGVTSKLSSSERLTKVRAPESGLVGGASLDMDGLLLGSGSGVLSFPYPFE